MIVNCAALRAAAASGQPPLFRCHYAARLCASSRFSTVLTTTAPIPAPRHYHHRSRQPAPSGQQQQDQHVLLTTRSRRAAAAFSTTPTGRLEQQPIVPPTPPPPPPPHAELQRQQQQQESRRRTRRRILFGAAFLLLGSTLGSLVRAALAPPDLPEPGTDKDAYLLASIAEKARSLPLHKQLSADPAWEGWDAYGSSSSAKTPAEAFTGKGGAGGEAGAGAGSALSGPSLTSRTLAGARALAYQHVFHNAATGELVSIVYLGGSIAGWPGVVHGGAIATLLDETLGRCAVRLFPARTGVTANLELDYKAPTRSEGFYVIRTRPVAAAGDESGGDGKKGDRKRWVAGTLERLDGTVCVRAKALFVVPKGVKLAPIADNY
ncbi:HotDog domain-containing protein [Microdochium bolleyi]|uniref:HotDog domain-containing protein n=1 Tax=Microdochium bolleyi TaxID=196109 RepID=A0A136JAE4_9PEZI|nr:HotDog domain-containing protein [Microdochium bolleyi]